MVMCIGVSPQQNLFIMQHIQVRISWPDSTMNHLHQRDEGASHFTVYARLLHVRVSALSQFLE